MLRLLERSPAKEVRKVRLTIGTKIAGGFALAIAILVALGILSYFTATNLIRSAERVAHTYQVLGELDAVMQALTDAETGQRGYVITGQKTFLEPFTSGTSDIDRQIANLRTLVSDNPDQLTRLQALDGLIATKIEWNRGTIGIQDALGFSASQQQIATGTGKVMMDKVRAAVDGMKSAEDQLMKVRDTAAKSNAASMVSIIVFGIPVALLLLAIVALLITRNISRPIGLMTGVARQLAEGDITAELPSVRRRDEIGILTDGFHAMSLYLRQMAATAQEIATGNLTVKIIPRSEDDVLGNALVQMVGGLQRLTLNVKEAVGVLVSSVGRIILATTQVAAAADQTAAGVTETTAAVEEVKQTAQVANLRATHVSEGAHRAVQFSRAGRKSVDETMEGMSRIRAQMLSIAGSIVRLGEQGKAIGEIISTVSDLAEQSNLLSVNAGIEAAEAGDQGKGFAVVAREVRSLADQSRQATMQVRRILGDVQKATGGAVMATEQGTKVVEAGVTQSVEVEKAIRLLAESIQEAAEEATQIAASSQEQVVGIDQVALAMESIRAASSQNVESARQTEVAAQVLRDLGTKLQHAVEQYRV